MSEKQHNLITTALVGAGVCIVLLKCHGRVVHQARAAVAYLRNPLRKQTVQVVNTFEECEIAVAKLKLYVREFSVRV